MGNFFKRARRGLIVLAPATLLVAMAASAAGPPDDVSPTLRDAMQRDLGLTSAQFSQYLSVERLAELQQEQLAAADESLARGVTLAESLEQGAQGGREWEGGRGDGGGGTHEVNSGWQLEKEPTREG